MDTAAMIVCIACAVICIAAFCVLLFLILALFVHVNKMRADVRTIILGNDPELAKAKIREWSQQN